MISASEVKGTGSRRDFLFSTALTASLRSVHSWLPAAGETSTPYSPRPVDMRMRSLFVAKVSVRPYFTAASATKCAQKSVNRKESSFSISRLGFRLVIFFEQCATVGVLAQSWKTVPIVWSAELDSGRPAPSPKGHVLLDLKAKLRSRLRQKCTASLMVSDWFKTEASAQTEFAAKWSPSAR